MSSRRYRLLCPLSRALDHVGDRWTLLILRDLHAGPVRHKELARGLTGIPSNVLATRLKELVENGLVQKSQSEHGVPLYSLTALGETTGPVLFELSKLGTRFPVEGDKKKPGNFRLAAVTLKEAMSRTADDSDLHVELRIDGEPLDIQAQKGNVEVRYRPAREPQAVIKVPYEQMIAYADGRITQDVFGNHVDVDGDAKVAARFMERLNRAMSSLR